MPDIITAIHALEVAVFGFFLWQLRQYVQKVDKLATMVINLKVEHDTYQKMGVCPLIKQTAEVKHEAMQGL